MATQKAAFMETDHPIVRKIWKILEQGIPPEHAVDATKLLPRELSRKSVATSAELRRLGNTSYTSGNFDEALIYYSGSVATAPADTEELALAYGNRSALFQTRMLYEPCLLDVNRALAGPVPPRTRHRLLGRKRMAWNKLEEQNNVRTGLRQGICYMKRCYRQEVASDAYERRLCYISKVGFDDVDLVIDHSELDDPIWNTKFDGTTLENVSPKIELKYDAQFGPHLVAKEDIDPGEPLCFEDVYSLSVFRGVKFKFCNYCHFPCEALIPCTRCPKEMYCSTGCREKAYDSYHRVECQLLPLWVDVDKRRMNGRALHLRAFLRITKQGSELANLMNSSVICEALNGKLNCANVQFSPENYQILANVVPRLRYSNDDSEAFEHWISEETIAVFARLRSIRFFGNEARGIQCSGYSLSELEYFGIMLLVYQISLTWSHLIFARYYCLVYSPTMYRPRETSGTIGDGFSLLHCFTHHSCDPNVRTAMNRRKMLVFSVRSIKAGEQIRTFCRRTYTMASRELRRKLYKSVGCPQCACKACVEDWPERNELRSRMDTYRTRDEEMLFKIQTMREWLLRDGSHNEEYLKKVIKISRTVREYVNEPSFTILLCESFIERMMLFKGNMVLKPT